MENSKNWLSHRTEEQIDKLKRSAALSLLRKFSEKIAENERLSERLNQTTNEKFNRKGGISIDEGNRNTELSIEKTLEANFLKATIEQLEKDIVNNTFDW
jgi:hypothetical protein